MTRKTGGAELPLHAGRVPEWLAARMAALGRVFIEALVLEYGRPEVLRRLSHPFWFQSLGAVMGMDWHSSGVTTSVIGALRRGLAPVACELGLFICGGRGRASRKTPDELVEHADRLGLDGDGLVRASRLVAKVDGAAVQDGFQLYLHGFILDAEGQWAVVQQGMCPSRRLARRYHWASEGLESFVDAPHQAIEGVPCGADIVNLADIRSRRARDMTLRLAQRGPEAFTEAVRIARREAGADESRSAVSPLPFLRLPLHHEVRSENVVSRRLNGALAAAAQAESFEALLLTPGLGPRTLATLAFVADVLHGCPSRFSDPARYSLALGGKDGHPFPVPLHVYDETLRVLRRAIHRARLGRSEGLDALRRLDAESRRLEGVANGPGFESYVAQERARSSTFGGRTVAARGAGRALWGHRREAAPTQPESRKLGQLPLFEPQVPRTRSKARNPTPPT